jgi:hypothetical protein
MIIVSFSSEFVPLLTTTSCPGDPRPFSPLPYCFYKISRFFLQLSALGHIFMIYFLLYYLFLLGCLQFPQIMGYILVLLSSYFLPFYYVTCWKSFMLSTVSNLFLQDTTKIWLYLVTIFGKGIKFHLSFFAFCFLAFGTCKHKTHVNFFS